MHFRHLVAYGKYHQYTYRLPFLAIQTTTTNGIHDTAPS